MSRYSYSYSPMVNAVIGAFIGAYAGFTAGTGISFLYKRFSSFSVDASVDGAQAIAATTCLLLVTGALAGAMSRPTRHRVILRPEFAHNASYAEPSRHSCGARIFRAAATGMLAAGLTEATLTLFIYTVSGELLQTSGVRGVMAAILFPAGMGIIGAFAQAASDNASNYSRAQLV